MSMMSTEGGSENRAPSGRPLVTFALMTYHQRAYVEAAVEGALAQTYEPLEIILSDDCSSDGTFEAMETLAARYSGPHTVKLRRNAANLGQAGHMNALVSIAAGQIIAWAHGDDVSFPERVTTACAPLLSDSNVVGTHSAGITIDTSGNIVASEEPEPSVSIDNIIVANKGIGAMTCIFRKSVMDKFGPLNDDVTNDTLPMTFRLLCAGRIEFISDPMIYYRLGGQSNRRAVQSRSDAIGEALKFARWRRAAFTQICQDMRLLPEIEREYGARIRERRTYYSCLVEINEKRLAFPELVELILNGSVDLIALKAFVRRNIPEIVF